MWGTEKAKTGLRTEMSQHVRGEERGLPFNEVRTPRRGWMQQLKDRRRRRNSKGGRCISPICHRDGEREGNGYRRCFFSSLNWGDVTLSVAGSSTLWRESPSSMMGWRERTFCSVRHYSSAVCVYCICIESVCYVWSVKDEKRVYCVMGPFYKAGAVCVPHMHLKMTNKCVCLF